MHTWAVIGSAWRWNTPALAGCGAVFLLYCVLNKFHSWSFFLWFLSGDALLALILCSPLDLLARDYLFTAEAVERVFVFFTVPYLLMRGFSEKMAVRLRLDRIRLHYAIAWTLGMVALSFWYLPSMLNAALASDHARAAEIVTLIAGGALFWSPLHSPARRGRIPMVPNALFYLVAATVWCSLLGLILAFEQAWYFPRYAKPLDVLGIADSLVRDWSFTRENDQQTGGLLFWIGAATVLLSEVMFTYYRWYVAGRTREDARSAVH